MTEPQSIGQTTSAPPSASDQLAAKGAHYQWGEIGFHPLAAAGVIIGLLVAVLGRFLSMIFITADGAEDFLRITAMWFDWTGLTLIAVSLIGGGVVSKAAHPGIRVAVIAIGLYVLLQTGNLGFSGLF